MLKSMTGYGRNAIDTEQGELSWELRSVNSRYLETSLRLPEELRALEPAVRDRIGKRLHRGKVEATMRLKANSAAVANLQLDKDALASLARAIGTVNEAMGNTAAVDPLKVMQWPGVLASASEQKDALHECALQSLDKALDDLVATREREGEKTAGMLSSRAQQISEHINTVRAHRPAVVQRQKQRLLAKLSELDVDHDAARVEQEIVIAAQKLDIDEELDRLDAHVSELLAALKRKGPVGRRLDFLMQEFNREANTVGSKSSDLDTTGASVDIKVLIEQMREQVQNLE